MAVQAVMAKRYGIEVDLLRMAPGARGLVCHEELDSRLVFSGRSEGFSSRPLWGGVRNADGVFWTEQKIADKPQPKV